MGAVGFEGPEQAGGGLGAVGLAGELLTAETAGRRVAISLEPLLAPAQSVARPAGSPVQPANTL